MTPESAVYSAASLPPMVVAAVSFVILLFGAVGAFIALRRKSGPEPGQDVPQWFYVRDLVHEVRNARMVSDATLTDVKSVKTTVDAIFSLLTEREK